MSTTLTLSTFTQQYKTALKHFNASNEPLVGALLTLAKTIADAESALPVRDFKTFCRHNNLGVFERRMPSRTAKLLNIGQAEPMFREHTNALPASITSLDYLSRLTPQRLTELTRDKTINPLMTTDDSRLLVVDTRGTTTDAKTPRPSKHVLVYSVTLEFYTADFTVPKLRSLLKTLNAFLSKHSVTIGLCPDVKLSADADLALLTDERKVA